MCFHLPTGDVAVPHGHLAGESADQVEGVEDDGEDAADEEEVHSTVAEVEEQLIESFTLDCSDNMPINCSLCHHLFIAKSCYSNCLSSNVIKSSIICHVISLHHKILLFECLS